MATLNEMAQMIDARMKADGGAGFVNDWAGFFDITPEQAERIAEKAGSAEKFERIWQNENWWV